jgi:hypothetical protein
MSFTALHRTLGEPPGPMTSEMIDAAVAQAVQEETDLDFKSELPPTKHIAQTDFPKDVAAMANSGGGVILFGVEETQKAATARVDVGELTEVHERALRSAAITAISPPVFGLRIDRLGEPASRCVAVTVAASLDGPHLIYRGEYFGAPVRNDADTVWMKERQIEAMYRARFDERRHATDSLDRIYSDAAVGRDTAQRAWFIAVAQPRIPVMRQARLSRDDARTVFQEARALTLQLARRDGLRPIEAMEMLNPRPVCAAGSRLAPALPRQVSTQRQACTTTARARWSLRSERTDETEIPTTRETK